MTWRSVNDLLKKQKNQRDNRVKLKLTFTCMLFAVSIVGFMVQLPRVFSHYDKELHFLFYFLASGMLNMLFSEWKLSRHTYIFVGLFMFGVGIELAQDYSNRLLHRRIHGNFDPEDVFFNLLGQCHFSVSFAMLYFCKRKP